MEIYILLMLSPGRASKLHKRLCRQAETLSWGCLFLHHWVYVQLPYVFFSINYLNFWAEKKYSNPTKINSSIIYFSLMFKVIYYVYVLYFNITFSFPFILWSFNYFFEDLYKLKSLWKWNDHPTFKWLIVTICRLSSFHFQQPIVNL